MNAILSAMVRASGRSWWEAGYADGTTIGEWETQPGLVKAPLPGRSTSRWEEIPKQGMRGLRLLCPNGQAGTLMGERFIQFKCARFLVGRGHQLDAHLIGVMRNDKDVHCFAWEYPYEWTETVRVETKPDHFENRVVRHRVEGKLVEFDDDVHAMKYQNVGAVATEPQQLVV